MLAWLGIQPKAMLSEQIISSLGGIISLFLIGTISFTLFDLQGSLAILTSMGAATVLLFALPHGLLSQPWALFIGNLVSAFVGVSCTMLIADTFIAAGVAVGLAIAFMHIFRCVHPPGGATALAAVIGGSQITDLGYTYLLIPVLLNCTIIFIIAMIFNNLFPWRKYPLTLMRYKPANNLLMNKQEITEQHLSQAMANMGTVFDISPAQLKKVYQAAITLRRNEISDNFDFQSGGVYTNNLPGAQWAVRKIIDHAPHPNPANALIIYRVLDGAGKYSTNSCTRSEFAEWASQRLQGTNE
jgi:CBS-domain-containing membrane protein